MDTSALRWNAVQLKNITGALEQVMLTTPDVLVRPTYDKMCEVQKIVLELLSDMTEHPDIGTTPPQEEKFRTLEQEISQLIEEFTMELNSQPWHNPPSLRKLRESGELIAKKITELHKQRRALFPVKYVSTGYGRAPAARAAGGANASGKGGSGGSGGPITVEEALSMVLDKKNVQYRGGLIGIVHAAGVQEMTPFSNHSPAKFDFLFQPKSQAAWNLHQFSQVI